MEKLVEIRNVTAWREGTRVFSGLSLEIPLGCSTVVLGPNGSGKTTFLRMLAGEVPAAHEEGSVMRIFGRERWNVWDLRSRLGVVSHDLQAAYWSEATGTDVVLSGYRSTPRVWPHHRFSNGERARAQEVLASLGLTGMHGRRFGSLSTGEQRRLLLARALVHDPDVLVLDEPTSGLDPQACFQYLGLVRGLIRSGKTVILVTHHIHEIPPEIDRIVLLDRGRVVADGTKEDLLTGERLSGLFRTPIEVVRANGYYHAVPGPS